MNHNMDGPIDDQLPTHLGTEPRKLYPLIMYGTQRASLLVIAPTRSESATQKQALHPGPAAGLNLETAVG
jgi:hypothetical protein